MKADNTMKKKLFCLLLSVTLLTGCRNQDDLALPFANMDGLNLSASSSEEAPDFFASDLAVIPDKLNHMSDPAITAEASLIVNNTDKKVIYANNVYERLYPASLTKLITTLVVLEKADLNDMVTISYNASHITESGAKLCGFKEGDTIKLEDLLYSFLIYSGNDAGVAIAEHVGGTIGEFAKMMNQAAKDAGAVHSNFVNPHGLHDDNHYTTAYDLYLIFHQLVTYDKFLSIINKSEYTVTYKDASGNPVTKNFLTTNRYLKGAENAPKGITVVGGKTGTTGKAGSCLILYSKDKNKKDYISLILKADSSDSLFSQMTDLLKMIK
ncbi:D-alanyl-D-alanine carboxypeptidase [Anaerocolumna jejuensis DSM 15929]|uniref:D-alanyl-D-alanine carboxypeptidase n=1 Tax=Anaerocolumna jejuensis DSM 15929 TaxID=1121322 RepID=A0A1M6JW21_9FIRM|nr:serine hydrolase [Anaerocolumna jejuensis]SHJ50880.1 D-alanyl-D-alanine carboxypeptidase [Anaerocolumna jejuensis DSM 15929]